MIFQYASDLHLEFPKNKDFLSRNPLEPIGDVLLLAGDIVPFASMNKHKDFFSYISDHFESTYWIPGNHEYYYYDLADKYGTFHEKIKDNVHLLNNTVIKNENIDLVFSSLWSKIGHGHQWEIEMSLNDFQVIKYKGYKLSVEQYNHIHKESVQFIKQALHLKTNKSIVVSHHVPTFYNYPERYKGDALNEAFASELFDLIEDFGPDYWIYGHTHSNSDDFRIGNTQLLTNQLGYVRYGEHQLFSPEKIFSL